MPESVVNFTSGRAPQLVEEFQNECLSLMISDAALAQLEPYRIPPLEYVRIYQTTNSDHLHADWLVRRPGEVMGHVVSFPYFGIGNASR